MLSVSHSSVACGLRCPTIGSCRSLSRMMFLPQWSANYSLSWKKVIPRLSRAPVGGIASYPDQVASCSIETGMPERFHPASQKLAFGGSSTVPLAAPVPSHSR